MPSDLNTQITLARLPGFYWIIVSPEPSDPPEVAKWNGNRWEYCGSGAGIEEAEVLSQRLQEPFMTDTQTTPPDLRLAAAATAICERRNAPDWPCNGLDFDKEMASPGANIVMAGFTLTGLPAPERTRGVGMTNGTNRQTIRRGWPYEIPFRNHPQWNGAIWALGYCIVLLMILIAVWNAT